MNEIENKAGAYGIMMARHDEAAIPIRERQAENERRAARRADIFSELEVLSAKVNVLTRSIEECLAQGSIERASEVKVERKELVARIDGLTTEAADLQATMTTETTAIEHDLETLAKRVLADTFPAIQQMCHQKIRDAIEFIEAAWNGLQQFEVTTKPCLSISQHRDRLTPSETLTDKEEKRLALAMAFWCSRDRGQPLSKI